MFLETVIFLGVSNVGDCMCVGDAQPGGQLEPNIKDRTAPVVIKGSLM